jgi:hypothetical protein
MMKLPPQGRIPPAVRIDRIDRWWDNPTMTVIADNKKRVTLPTKPGERFDLTAFGEDKFVLTRLAPVEMRTAKVTFRRVRGRTVAKTDQPINVNAIKRALEEFP